MKKLFLSMFSAISFAVTGFSQVVAGSSFFDEIVSDWHMGCTLDTDFGAAIPSDLHNAAGGTLGVYEATALIKFQGVRNGNFINANVGYTHSYYDFSEISPFSDTNKVSVNIFYSRKIDDEWSIFGLYLGNLAAETGGDLFDGGRMMASVGGAYKFSDTFRMGLGIAALSRLDNDWIPLPIGYIEWDITEKLSLRTFTGAALIYDFFGDGTLLLNLSCQYSNTDFRLTDSPAGENRSFRDSYMQTAFGATYNMTESTYLSASIGGNFFRKIVFRTPSGSGDEIEVDSAPIFYLHFGVNF